MKTYWGGGIAPRILNLGARWRWVVSFTPGRFTPGERAPGTHWIGRWVGPESVWTLWQREKFSSPAQNRTAVAQRYTDWATHSIRTCIKYRPNIPLCFVRRMFIVDSKGTRFGWPQVALRSYRISWKSISSKISRRRHRQCVDLISQSEGRRVTYWAHDEVWSTVSRET